ncbi:MAG: zinc ribbon domain-containing protein [Ignavibacteria bacterium]
MPTYDYKCDDCGHEFEVYQSMKDAKLTTCPNCGKNTLRRLIGSGSGLIFKGSGFYLTDYKNKSVEPANSSSSGDTKKTEVSGSSDEGTKTDSKTTATSDSGSNAPETKKSVKSENRSSEKTEKKSSSKKSEDK